MLYMYAAFEEVNSGSVHVKPTHMTISIFYGLAHHQPLVNSVVNHLRETGKIMGGLSSYNPLIPRLRRVNL